MFFNTTMQHNFICTVKDDTTHLPIRVVGKIESAKR